MSKEKPYHSLDHTADLGVEAWGNSWEDLVVNLSLALSDTLVEVERVKPVEESQWSVRADSREALIVKHLEEILFRLDAEGRVFSRFEIFNASANFLDCRAYGEPLDQERHQFKTELKAVTYHQLKVEEVNGKWRAQVIFDV